MKKLNTNIIPYIVAVAQGLQVGHAGYIYLGWFGAFLGGVLGLSITLSVANAASRLDGIAKARKPMAYAGLVMLLLLSPLAVAPAAYLSFDIPVEWVLIMASVVWAIAPDACMVLSGAIAGKSLVQADDKPKSTGVTETPPKSARTKRKSVAGWPRKCEYCGASIASPNGVGGHMKKHHPEMCQRRVIPVDLAGVKTGKDVV